MGRMHSSGWVNADVWQAVSVEGFGSVSGIVVVFRFKNFITFMVSRIYVWRCLYFFNFLFWYFFLACCSKGMSSSALPYKRTPPSWLKITTAEVEDHICKLAKKGLTPSQIGVILRDSHGIAQVNSVTGSKVLRILKGHGSIWNPNFLAFCTPHWQAFS
jgi:small subunit ribosomal protein S13e